MKRAVMALAALGLLLSACSARLPWQPSPVETALLTSRQALDGAAEWYADACVRRVAGLAASEATCERYRAKIGPATHAAHNAAVEVAVGARDGLVALSAVQSALRLVQESAAIDGDARRIERVYFPLVLALTMLERRIQEAMQ